MTNSRIIKMVEKHMATITRERDLLEEHITLMMDLKESCNKAYDSLQDAKDALSEYV